MIDAEKIFAKKWTKELSDGLLKSFPSDFVSDVETTVLSMPGKQLLLGPELFGNFEIIDIQGNLFHNAGSIEKAKFILYANRSKPKEVNIPANYEDVKNAVRQYEIHIDNLLRGLEKEFKKEFGNSKNFHEISNHIFISLNLTRY